MHRHDLVWIDPQARWTALTLHADARLRAWVQARLPLVVARRDPVVDGTRLRLGVPLPLSEQRQRLALQVDPDAVMRHSPPPPLMEVADALAVSWRPALLALQQQLQATGQPPPRVFGSYAWQALTGLDYLHAGSDLDLLWAVQDHAEAQRICALLQHWEQQQALRADGELVFAGGRAVNWREYASAASQLLVKSDAHCWLAPRAAFDDPAVPSPAAPARSHRGAEHVA